MYAKAQTGRALSSLRFVSRSFALRSTVAQLLAFLLLVQTLAPLSLAAPLAPKVGASRKRTAAPAPKAERAKEPAKPVDDGAARLSGASVTAAAAQEFGVVLTAIGTPFHDHAGIDHHQPSNKLVVSAYGPAGQPNNFEVVGADGAHREFTNIAGLAGDLKLATARDDGQGLSRGGFRAGELFTSTGVAGVVARVSPDGAAVQNPWVTLGGEGASAIGGLHVDRAGDFGGDLIAVTEGGEIWRVTSAGAATLVADLDTPLTGATTIPNDAPLYGPWAGRVLVGAKAQGAVYAVDAQGNAAAHELGLGVADVRVIPPHENFYGVDPTTRALWGAPAAAFTGMIGDILVAQDSPGVLAAVRWNGSEFVVSRIAQVARWSQTAFSPAGVSEILPVKQVYERIAVVRHAPVINSGRVEGALWQLTGEPVTLDGTDTITSDLLVPGAPAVSVHDTGSKFSFGGVIQGVESAQPAGYAVNLTGNASLRHLITRTNPVNLETVAAPPAPAGTRDVSLTQTSQAIGDFGTLRHLTLSGRAGTVAVPPGTYGKLSASGRTVLVFGQENSAQPVQYNLEELSLSGGSELRVVGPVNITVKRNVTLTGSSVGAPDDPRRVSLKISEGALGVTGNSVLYGVVRIPQGAVNIEGNGRVRGTVTCDRLAVSGNGVLQITENDLPPPPVNRPPAVNAGADQTITLPADTISLNGTVTDDGLPQGSTLGQVWSQVSGPGPVVFANPGSPATTASFGVPGEYVLKLKASDSLLTASDTLNVTIVPRNQPPTVNAGPDQTVELPAEAALQGAVSDDALPRGAAVAINWSMVSGPGSVSFGNAALPATSAAFSAPGDYVLRLSANDTEFTVADELTVTVHPQNQPPTADAGPDQLIALPNGAILSGVVNDDGWPLGSTLTSTWTKASGPGDVTFANPNNPTTNATFSAPGTYTLLLTANDSRLTASDEVSITVDPRNQPPSVEAGAAQTIELPNTASLVGTVSDDSFPRGSTVTQTWSVTSGPGNVVFADASQPATTAAFSAPGDYVLRLTASDSEFTVADEVAVTVHPQNQPPTADAGPEQTVRLPQTAGLQGTAADDGWPFGSTLTATWTKASGPGAVTFENANSPTTIAAFGEAGTYVLRLTVNDSRLEASDEVTVIVLPANVGPVADAGPDRTAQLRANLLRNGGNEEELFENRIVGWGQSPVDAWLRGAGGAGNVSGETPFGVEGAYFFFAGEVPTAELTQDVDVSAFAASVAAGTQQFEFQTYVRSRGETTPDSCQVFVEYRDAANQNVLATFDSGPLTTTAGWTPVRDTRTAPAGTGWIRVRLVSTRRDGLTNDAYFDAASLRAVTGVGVKLEGRAADDGLPAGSTLALSWTKTSGPGEVAFADAGSATTAATFTEPGAYVLRFAADDSEFSAGDEVTVNIATANQPPTIEAGQEQTVTLPAAASLAGTATDDGLPSGSTLAITWTKASGPGEVTFADAHSLTTTATFAEPGTYVLRLSAGDSEFTFHDEIVIQVKPANRAPEVSAGPDQAVTLPAAASLSGTATDDGNPAGAALAITWSAVSGPGPVSFGDPAQPVTTAAFNAPGTYVLRLTANDSELSTSDDMTVVVAPAPVNQPPVVSAGPDASLLLTDTASLQGTATDDGLPTFSVVAASWSKVSGPGAVTFANAASPATTATFSEAGTYVLRLTATDSQLTASDDVQLVVRRAPVAGFTVPGVARNAAVFDNNVGSFNEGATVVSFSSQASTTYLATFAIDDDHSTRWRSLTGQITNQHLTLRLPGAEPREFHRVRLVNTDGTEGVKNFRVLVSTTTADDAAFSVALADTALNVSSRVQEFLLPAPVKARFVRFLALDNYGATVIGLRSFELVDDTLAGLPAYYTHPSNVAAAPEGGKVAAFSSQSTNSSLFATSAIDDNTTSRWSSATNQVVNQSLTVELALGRVYTIDRVRLYNFEGTSNQAVRNFRVEVSETTLDAAAFREVFTGTAQNAAGAQEFVFTQGAARARYVRLVALSNYGSTTNVSLRELQAVTVPTNLAAVSSYDDAAYRPELMLDADPDTAWRTLSGKVTDQKVTLRLGLAEQAPLVEQVLIQPSSGATTEAVKDFEVLVSATGADNDFTSVLTGTVQNNAQLQKFAFPGGPVRAGYVRLVARNNYGSPTSIRVATFQAVAAASEGNIISAPASPNVAANQSPSLLGNGAALVSSSGQVTSTTGPTHMLDYVYGNWWAAPNAANQSVVVKLAGEQPHTLRGVRVGPRLDTATSTESVKTFEVWASSTTADAAAFTRVLTGTVLNNRTLQTFNFAGPVAAKFVKYVPLANYGSATAISTSNFDVIADGAAGVADYSTVVNYANRPEFATDGNNGTSWQTATGSVTSQFITLALPGAAPQQVYGVRIDSESSNGPKEIEVRVSETTADAGAFTTVYTGTLAQATGEKEILFGAVRAARYVQFFWKNGYSPSTVATRELEVLAVPRTGAAVVGFSSQINSTTGPTFALDFNRTNAAWQTPVGQNANQFFVVALPRHEAWTIDHVALEPFAANDDDTPRNFEVQVSTTGLDDASFATVLTGALRNEKTLQHYFFAPARARYVRLVLRDNHGGTQMRLQTFWVFSPQVGARRARFLDRSRSSGAALASYLWDFGDGQSSSERDPSHLFAAPGTYNVRLTVTDSDQLASSHTIPYEALGSPLIDFTFSPNPANEGASVSFTDTSSDPNGATVVRDWAWGDNSANNVVGGPGVTHTFRDSGGFGVTLTASNDRGISDSTTKVVPILNLPPSVEAGTSHSIPWGQPWNTSPSVSDPSAIDRASLLCAWDYGDGNAASVPNCDSVTARAPHAYAAPGVYTARLTVTDKDGGAASDSLVVTATRRPTTTIYLGSRSIQQGQPVALKARVRDSLAWQPLGGKTVRFTLGAQTVEAVTDAEGDAAATIVYNGTAASESVTAAFVEDALHFASAATIAASCPAESQPIDAALVIDRSGSMSGQPLTDAQNGASIFVESLNLAHDQVAVVSFDDTAVLNQSLTHDAVAALNAINTDALGGSTNIGAGIDKARVELTGPRRNPFAAPVMLVLSDGRSSGDPAAAAQVAKNAGIRVIAIGLGGVDETQMKAIASSPSDYYFSASSSNLGAIYSSIVSTICKPANQPPSVNAGNEQSVTLPNNTVTLNGTVGDDGLPAGAALTSTWSKLSGPGPSAVVAFANASAATTTATFNTAGTYVLRLTASDTQYSRSADVTVTVNPPAPTNLAPTVSAGPDLAVTLPAKAALNGIVSDDGLPAGSQLAVTWSKVSGPGPSAVVTFTNSSSATTLASFSEPGVYVLRLTASDSELSSSDDVSVTVNAPPPNLAPTVNAGPDQSITLPALAPLAGTFSDDGKPDGSTTTVVWSKASGPGAVTFANPSSATTTAAFSVEGVYTLRLTASDTELSAADEVVVAVSPAPPNDPPVAEAGAPQTIALGVNLVQNPSGEEPLVDGKIRGWTEAAGIWTQASGGADGFPAAHRGGSLFYAGESATAELRQDIDLSAFAASIAAGTQQFEWLAYVRSRSESPVDGAQVLFEYRNAANTQTIATLTSPVITTTTGWHLLEDKRAAPAGTGWVRIRLIATRNAGTTNDAYFDALSLRAVTGAGLKLAGAVTDDGRPAGGALTSQWSKVSGPGTVTFRNADAAATSATFSAAGNYVLRLTASDSQHQTSDELSVTVEPANTAPNVSAGSDFTVTLPDAANLDGTVTDDGKPAGAVVQTTWSKVSGPGTVTFADAAQATTTATFGAPGTYVLRLAADDSEYAAGDNVTVTVNPEPVNQRPTVSAGADQTVEPPATSATLAGAATDDGLPRNSTLAVTWSQVSGPGAVTFSQPNQLTTGVSFGPAGVYVLRLTATDGALSASDDVVVRLNGVNTAPTVNAGADQTVTLPAKATLAGSAADDGLPLDSTLAYAWVKVSGPGTVTFTHAQQPATDAGFSTEGTYVLRLTASDSALSASDEVAVTVNPAVPPPTVDLATPADGSVITGRTVFVGTVSEGSTWRLEYRLGGDVDDASPGGWTTISSGNTPVTNGALGVFDPTVMLNGTYKVRLVATNSAGASSFITSSATVEGNQKLGNFTVSFSDLNVPVGGLPIQVERTYDSRDKRVGDFGVGWTLGLKNIRVEKSGVIGKHWRETVTGGIIPNYCLTASRPTFVSVVFPDGKLYKFEAKASRSPNSVLDECQRGGPITNPSVWFKPLPGTKGRLESLQPNDPMVFGSIPGNVELRNIGDVELYNPTLWKYTAEDGTAYVVDQQAGVRSVTDLNGNTLTVNADGISHSDGKNVAFTRDALGRITKITDPDGTALVYAYDAAGDLVAFTDRDNNTTTYTYNTRHHLLKILDPLGRQAVLAQYDETGRLTGYTDADGKPINLAHDPDGRSQTITDRLGNVTRHEFDANGNVIRTVDPLGNVTTRTYDANNNKLTETNALGFTTTYTYDAQDHLTSKKDALGNVTRHTYDANGKVLTTTDPRGHVTTNTYDPQGNVLTSTDALGNKTTFTYGFRGARLSMTNALGHQTTYQIDTEGKRVKETNPLGHVTGFGYNRLNMLTSNTVTRTTAAGAAETLTTSYSYTRDEKPLKTTYPDGTFEETAYNAAGQKTATVDQQGRRTAFEYDSNGRVTKTTYHDGTSEATTYDAEGRATKETDRAGRVVNFTYDALGRLVKTAYPDGKFTSTTFDAIGRITSTTDERGRTTRFEYDPNCGCSGRRAKVIDALGRATSFGYDANGNQTSITDPKGNVTRFEYDALNRRTKVVFPDGTERRTAYDAVGRVTSETDQAGRTTQFEYDDAGRLTKVTDALGQPTRYAYDERGRMTGQTDANNHTTAFEYDRMGRRTRRTLPLGMSETYAYNAAGLLQSRTDFRGKTTTYAYDAMGRPLSKTPDASLAEPAVVYTYTPEGLRATMTDASGTTSYTYDARGRLSTKQTPQGALSYTYDAAGNPLTVRSSNENGISVDYAYDALGRLSAVTDNRLGAGATTYAYDPNGNLERVAYANGVTSSYAYNTLNRLTNVSAAAASATVASYAYTLGAAGNRLSVAEHTGRAVNYTYDPLYRLTQESVSGGPAGAADGAAAYTYDAVGNRLTRVSTVAGLPDQALAYDANDRLQTDTYDAGGNTLAANGTTYRFDFENRLAEAGDGAVRYLYDGDGTRVGQTAGGVTTRFLVDTNNHTGHSQVVEELRGGEVVRQYTYGHDLVSQRQLVGGQWRASFYGYDGHGSVRYLTDADGAVTDTYTYDAYGVLLARTGSTPNDYLYAGERFDPNVGFYHLRARYLNPQSGRFMSMDLVDGNAFDPSSLHKYTYANGDPVNRVDPSGLFGIAQMSMTVAVVGILSSMAMFSYATYKTLHHLPNNPFSESSPTTAMVGAGASLSLSKLALRVGRGHVLAHGFAAGLALAQGVGGGDFLIPLNSPRVWMYTYWGGKFGVDTADYGTADTLSVSVYAGLMWKINKIDDYEGAFYCSTVTGLSANIARLGFPTANLQVCSAENGVYGFSINVLGTRSTSRSIMSSITKYSPGQELTGVNVPPVSASYEGLKDLARYLVNP